MSTPTGFLVVRSAQSSVHGGDGLHRLHYHGVDRVPPHPTDDEAEAAAVHEYVFGDYKDEETNVIPSFDAAVRLLRLFSSSRRYEYELIYCCKDVGDASVMERDGVPSNRSGSTSRSSGRAIGPSSAI